MVPFYGWSSTVSRLQNHYEEPPRGFEPGTPGLGIQWESSALNTTPLLRETLYVAICYISRNIVNDVRSILADFSKLLCKGYNVIFSLRVSPLLFFLCPVIVKLSPLLLKHLEHPY